jgi:hypothetical protein
VPIWIGILGIYKGPLKQWVDSVLKAEEAASTRMPPRHTLTIRVVAVILVIAVTIAWADTIPEIFTSPEKWVYDFTSTLAVYVFMVTEMVWAVLVRRRYALKLLIVSG